MGYKKKNLNLSGNNPVFTILFTMITISLINADLTDLNSFAEIPSKPQLVFGASLFTIGVIVSSKILWN